MAVSDASVGAPAPSESWLRAEVGLVLALSLGASGVYAALDLLKGYVATKVPLAQQTTTLYAPRAPQPWLDITYQLVDLALGLAPVLLVAYLLTRSGESLSAIGVDASQPRRDTAWGSALAAVVGGVGLVALLASKSLGLNRQIIIGSGAPTWWGQLLLVGQAAGTALSEEIIVCGFLLHRLRQLRWRDNRALLAASLVRGSYHLYQGWGGFAGNFVLGLFFGRLFQRRGRAAPLILAHFLIDAVAFVGYVHLKGRVHWLP